MPRMLSSDPAVAPRASCLGDGGPLEGEALTAPSLWELLFHVLSANATSPGARADEIIEHVTGFSH